MHSARVCLPDPPATDSTNSTEDVYSFNLLIVQSLLGGLLYHSAMPQSCRSSKRSSRIPDLYKEEEEEEDRNSPDSILRTKCDPA